MTEKYDNWRDPNDDVDDESDRPGPSDKGSSREERSKDQADRHDYPGGLRD
jgi:hypothetical protein